MTGLENIIKGIEDEAKLLADDILKKAKKEADDITNRAKQMAMNETLAISDETEKQIKLQEEKSKALAELERKRIILKGKNDAINFIMESAKTQTLNMQVDKYFDLILKLVNRFLSSKPATIMFSEKDLKRMSSDFESKLLLLAESKGSQLKISRTAVNIKGGFILNYGEIEENCSVEALFESFHDAISDRVSKELFSA